jgi:integrase/recombinase XerD
MGTNQ